MIRLLTQAGSCRMAAAALAAAIFWGASAPVQARIDRFEILKTEPAFEGRSFDGAGEFERIIARAHGSRSLFVQVSIGTCTGWSNRP